MRKYILNLVTVLAMGFAAAQLAAAQNVSLPYQMNFEANETAELGQWVLNPGANASQLLDQWVVGNSVHSAGRQSLYISNNGQDAMFDSVPAVQYAYRDMILPAGQCILTFDWFCIGGPSSSLYVGVGDFSGCTLEANTTGTIPNTIKNPVASRMTYTNLYGSESWMNASYTFTSDGVTPTRLVFAWENKNRDKSACTIGACVDNIVITNTRCRRPSDVSASVISCDSALVTWTGNSQSYEVNYRMVGTSTWISETRFMVDPTDYTKVSAYITNLDEGNLEIRVRGICTPDTSAWMYGPELVVFCPERHCVNFTDLAASTVTCTYGNTNVGYSASYPETSYHAYDNTGIVDYGSESILSRHTVNWDKTATDPRTGNVLPLIPKGGYASVRLGNWEDNYGAESITYEYVVDSSNAVLLMQYAVVLQDPDGHEDDSPRFLLEILDENNNLIEPTCGTRNFVATYVDRDEWGSYTPEDDYWQEPVLYKPWTTVGLNLRELGIQDGQVIRVRLTTFDCFWGGHYGYAYFTLDCAKATIESASCAKDVAASMTLIAPDGFKYQWYDKFGNAIPGATSRVYEPQDTATYRCRLTSTENAACHFDLYSACVPRLPAPEFTWNARVELCQHKIDINNRSHSIILQRNDTIHDYASRCDENVWEISGTLTDGTPYGPMQNSSFSPLLTLPGQGGDFTVTLRTSLIGGCDSTLVKELHLSDVAIHTDTIHRVLCRPVNEPTGKAWLEDLSMWVSNSGIYTQTYTAVNGCDSTMVYEVKVGNAYNVCLGDTTLCYGEKLQVGNTVYDSKKKTSGQWGDFSLKTSLGCDSVVYYNVTVTQPIEPVIKHNDEVLPLPYARVDLDNGEVSVDLSVTGTGFDSYTMSYRDAAGKPKTDTHTPEDSILAALPVNEYIFAFYNADGCVQMDTVLVGGDTLCIDLLSQIQCECGKPVLNIPYRKCAPANKARLASCTVVFGDADKTAQGFADELFTGLKDEDTIRISVPMSAEPGSYAIDLIFDTVVGGCIWGQNAFHTSIQLTYDSSVIFHRWNDNAIISLAGANYVKKPDGSAYALYAFSDFQWLVNGVEVEGATRSYMEQPGKLDMSDAFSLRMTRTDGERFTTCAYIPGHNTSAPSGAAPAAYVSPADPMAGAPVDLSLTEEADVEIYSVMGYKVFARHFNKGVSSFAAPVYPGVYIMNVRMNGEVLTLRLRVR